MVEQRRVERAWPWQHDEDRITMVDLCRACSGLDTEVGVLLMFFTSMAMDSCCSPTKWPFLALSCCVGLLTLAFELWPYLIGPSCLGQI